MTLWPASPVATGRKPACSLDLPGLRSESDTPRTEAAAAKQMRHRWGVPVGTLAIHPNGATGERGSRGLAQAAAYDARSPPPLDGAGSTGAGGLQREASSVAAKRPDHRHTVVSEQAQDCRERSCQIMRVPQAAAPPLARLERRRLHVGTPYGSVAYAASETFAKAK